MEIVGLIAFCAVLAIISHHWENGDIQEWMHPTPPQPQKSDVEIDAEIEQRMLMDWLMRDRSKD